MKKVAFTIAAAAQAAAGCYWPVPDCNERVKTETVYPTTFVPQADGGFIANGKAYPSCVELCADQAGVKEVFSCEGPRAGGAYDGKVTCSVRALVCDEQEIIGHLGSGRLTAGIAVPRAAARTVGAYFARVAMLEAAAVHAFDRMVIELTAHGAPDALVLAARAAARDERRHTRIARSLARRFGAVAPALPAAPTFAVRDLEAIAIENGVEGCVREMAGAALVTFQANAAHSAHLRRVFRAIARDEIAHAELSWRVHAWLASRLEPAARRRVQRAMAAATRSLDARELSSRSRVLRDAVGLPRNENADAMVGVVRGFSLLRLPSGRRSAAGLSS